MDSSVDVSIIIVSFNTHKFLEKCLNSLLRFTKGISFEIIVIDNNSSDKSVELVKKKFPQIKLIANKVNKFFTGANNQGAKIARGKYLLFFAPDAYLIDNSVKKIFDYLQIHESVGACEGLELYENGKPVPTGSKVTSPLIDFFELSLIGSKIKNQKLINDFRIKNKKRSQDFEVDVGCDAFLMIRSDLFKKIKMYDTGMKLYYTENDLCHKIKSEGFSIVHLGSAKIIHTVSVSTNALGWKKNDIYYEDLRTYYKKHKQGILGNLLYLDLKIEKQLLQIREWLKFHEIHS